MRLSCTQPLSFVIFPQRVEIPISLVARFSLNVAENSLEVKYSLASVAEFIAANESVVIKTSQSYDIILSFAWNSVLSHNLVILACVSNTYGHIHAPSDKVQSVILGKKSEKQNSNSMFLVIPTFSFPIFCCLLLCDVEYFLSFFYFRLKWDTLSVNKWLKAKIVNRSLVHLIRMWNWEKKSLFGFFCRETREVVFLFNSHL